MGGDKKNKERANAFASQAGTYSMQEHPQDRGSLQRGIDASVNAQYGPQPTPTRPGATGTTAQSDSGTFQGPLGPFTMGGGSKLGNARVTIPTGYNMDAGDQAPIAIPGTGQLGQVYGDISNIRDRDYSSYLNADVDAARGGYRNFAETGGISAQDAAGIRNRATSAIPGLYSRASEEIDRGATLQGGYGVGRDVLKQRLRRQQVADLTEASLQAEGQVLDRRLAGQQFGVSGLSNLGMATADRNLQRDAGVVAAQQGLLDSERSRELALRNLALQERGVTTGGLTDSATAIKGGEGQKRDWLATAAGLGATAATAYGAYRASR